MGSFNVALLEALLSAGVSPERARAVVDLFDRSIDERYSLHAQVLATKRDVAELEVRLGERMATVEVRLVERTNALDARLTDRLAANERAIASLGSRFGERLADTRSGLVRWMLAALTAQTAMLIAAMRLL